MQLWNVDVNSCFCNAPLSGACYMFEISLPITFANFCFGPNLLLISEISCPVLFGHECKHNVLIMSSGEGNDLRVDLQFRPMGVCAICTDCT